MQEQICHSQFGMLINVWLTTCVCVTFWGLSFPITTSMKSSSDTVKVTSAFPLQGPLCKEPLPFFRSMARERQREERQKVEYGINHITVTGCFPELVGFVCLTTRWVIMESLTSFFVQVLMVYLTACEHCANLGQTGLTTRDWCVKTQVGEKRHRRSREQKYNNLNTDRRFVVLYYKSVIESVLTLSVSCCYGNLNECETGINSATPSSDTFSRQITGN